MLELTRCAITGNGGASDLLFYSWRQTSLDYAILQMLKVGWISPIFRPLQVLHREIRFESQHIRDRPSRQFRFVKITVARSDVAVAPPVQQIHVLIRFDGLRISACLEGGDAATIPVP